MEKEKIALVTGANGFIGSHLAVKLVNQGFHVLGMYRRNSAENKEFNVLLNEGKIERIAGDITTFDFDTLPKVDYIFHVAGKVGVWGKLEDFRKVNVEGTKRLLEFAKRVKPECFTFFSSSSVYGYYGYENLIETDEKKPFGDPYSTTKLEAEKVVSEFCSQNKIDYVIIRPCNVYGEYDRTSSDEIYGRIKNEKMLICANGKYKSCFVYAGNLANATIMCALNKTAHNTDYNVSDENSETLKEMFTAIAKEFNVRPKFFNVPAPLAKLTACLVEGWYKLFRIKKTPLITKFSVWQNCTNYHFSIEKLRKIGYSPKVSMEEGIKRTVKWFNESEEQK